MDEAKMPSGENAQHVPRQDAALQCSDAQAKEELQRRSGPFRIVMVNDEPYVLQSFEIVLRDWFKLGTPLLYLNPFEAWQELCQTDPDLLITGDAMPGLRGSEICQRLLARKVSYPIIVNSTWEPTETWARDLANRGLNVSFLPLPAQLADLRNLVEAALKTRCEQPEPPAEITSPAERAAPVVMVTNVAPTKPTNGG
jgi:DNA-binding NtrC family response regulator